MTHPIFARIDSALSEVDAADVTAKADWQAHEDIAWAKDSAVKGSRVFYKGVLIHRVRADGWSVDWTPLEVQPRDPVTGRWIAKED